MYYLMLVALMFVLPIATTIIEVTMMSGGGILVMAGKWFVFWSVGVRLLVAGLRQMSNPSFTARDIFEIADPGAGKIVTELGFANLSLGLIGLLSLWFPAWVMPSAISGGLYLGLAGYLHTRSSQRNAKENAAMVSDLFVCLALAIYAVGTILGGR